MIKQISDNSDMLISRLKDSRYTGKITANFDAYGLGYDFCRFFAVYENDRRVGTVSLFNATMICEALEGEVFGSESVADFAFMIRINKPTTCELEQECAKALMNYVSDGYTLGERHEFEFQCPNGLPELTVDETPRLDDVFDILKTGFPNLVSAYDLWLTDTSHRIRRGLSQAFVLNGCTTATIQYIVGSKALIGQVATLPEMRGKHYARLLLYYIGERLGMDGINVRLFARNHRKSYYEEIGFREIGVDYVLDIKDGI